MVGNIIIYIFLFFTANSIFASSEIVLRMLDMNHKSIKQAMCQAPFILQVELKNLEDYSDIHVMQYITGIENFKSTRSVASRNISIDNGKKTVKIFYNFVLRADKKGNFTVGPFSLQDASGNFIRSNRLIIPIGDEVIASEKDAKDKYFMTMSFNKKQAYVGEKLTFSIKFYDRLFVDDLHLQFPDFTNLRMVKNKNNIHKSMVVFEEEEYCVTEWIFDMYATESGPLIMQDIQAAFFAPELENKFKFGGPFDLFRSLHKSQQQITAQPIKIDILPLPAHKDFHDVHAVGQFSKFTVSANQNVIAADQGIVLTTELFGNGNFEMMQSPVLALPEGFKYYDAKMMTIDEARTYKHCEFIVQATVPGTYHIEPQLLVYFDPVDEQYKTLQSNGIVITITPSIQLAQLNHVDDTFIDQAAEEGEIVPKQLQDYQVIQQESTQVGLQCMIPLDRFQKLVWFLMGLWLLLIVYRMFIEKYILQHWVWNKFIIFFQARKAYNRALQGQQTYKLHAIFMQLFRQLIGMHFEKLHETAIVHYLVDKGFSDEQVEAWKIFYQQILYTSFSSTIQIQQQVVFQKQLFEQALQWIQLLKDKA